MKTVMKYIARDNFSRFLVALKKDYQVYAPVKKENQRFFRRFDGSLEGTVIGEVRAFEPAKAFFSRAREMVARGFKADIPHAADKPFALVGVKACDLKGFKVQDHVFMNHDYKDPFYAKLRENNLIISADCTCSIDTCFCRAVDVEPYPTDNFDINLSEIDEGFLVEAATKKGQRVIENNSALFQESNDQFLSRRDKRREKVIREVENNIKENKVPDQARFKGIIEKNYESDIWEDEAKTCVECGACTVICPTCHCFLIYDQQNDEKMARLRIWDSCMLKNYARVAGGANPRPKLWMRLRNRFEKKFDFFPKVADMYACTGCGRCISACPAKIDIREVLERLVENA